MYLKFHTFLLYYTWMSYWQDITFNQLVFEWPVYLSCVAQDQKDAYLKMKIKRTRREKKTATLSIVRNMTTNCLRRLGMKRTNFRIRRRRKVRSTLRPELPSRSPVKVCASSNILKEKFFIFIF